MKSTKWPFGALCRAAQCLKTACTPALSPSHKDADTPSRQLTQPSAAPTGGSIMPILRSKEPPAAAGKPHRPPETRALAAIAIKGHNDACRASADRPGVDPADTAVDQQANRRTRRGVRTNKRTRLSPRATALLRVYFCRHLALPATVCSDGNAARNEHNPPPSNWRRKCSASQAATRFLHSNATNWHHGASAFIGPAPKLMHAIRLSVKTGTLLLPMLSAVTRGRNHCYV